MMINGLRPIATVLESEALLVGAGNRSALASSVVTMTRAVVAARRKRYVLMNAPADRVATIERIIPGMEAPSVVPLAHNGMVAVHSVVDADDVWRVLPELEHAGASGILVLPIQQMIP
jgi:ATP phosphoribosyltransferase